VTESSSNCDESVTAETLGSDGCDRCDAFFEINQNNENFVVDETKWEPPASSSETENLAESVNQGANSITVAEPIEMITSQSSHPSVTTHHNPSHPSQEVDYSTFPHLTCDSIEAKRNQSEKIKQRLLEAGNREELTAIKQEESVRVKWVWSHLLNDAERDKLEAICASQQRFAIANTEQLTLPLAQDESTAAEKVAHPSLVNRWVQVFGGTYNAPGVGVVEVDRGNGYVEVLMKSGRVQVLSKNSYQLLDEEVE
jgi:putative DNA primase/helicase